MLAKFVVVINLFNRLTLKNTLTLINFLFFFSKRFLTPAIGTFFFLEKVIVGLFFPFSCEHTRLIGSASVSPAPDLQSPEIPARNFGLCYSQYLLSFFIHFIQSTIGVVDRHLSNGLVGVPEVLGGIHGDVYSHVFWSLSLFILEHAPYILVHILICKNIRVQVFRVRTSDNADSYRL